MTQRLKPADAPATTPSREQIGIATSDGASTQPQPGPGAGGNVADAFTSRFALPAVPSPSAERPLEILVTAPIQAWHGSTFDVSVGVPLGAVVRSVKFRVSYDADSLEVLNVIDATGTMLMAVPSGDGSVELDFDTDQGAIQAPAVRFLARADIPHQVQINVSADAWDTEGKALAIAPIGPYPIMLVP